MNMKGCFFVATGVLFLVLCAGSLFADVFAKENDAESLYGKGVHAFFDADYRSAIKFLSKVAELDSEDPRPYFFGGLAQLRLGHDDEAEAMLKQAAAFEWSGRSTREFNVSDALKRIQGLERLYIESFRRQAKLEAEQADQNRQLEKYGQEQDEHKSILAKLAKGSELPPPEPSRFIGVAPFGARSIDPFRDPNGVDNADKLIPADGVTPITKSSKAPTVKEPARIAAPMKPKDTKKDGGDPFGTSADEKKEKPAADTAPAKPKDTKKDDEDPFGASADEKKAADPPKDEKKEEKKEEKKDDDDDPFK